MKTVIKIWAVIILLCGIVLLVSSIVEGDISEAVAWGSLAFYNIQEVIRVFKKEVVNN